MLCRQTFLKTKHSETDAKIEALESNVDKLESAIQAPPTSNSLETMLAEIKERELRTRNIIIYGVSESHFEKTEERKKADKVEALRITRTADPNCPEPVNVIRLGKFNPSKIRPVRVSYESKNAAVSILRNSKNVKTDTAHTTIKIFPDQTPLQQANKKALKEELTRRIENGESN